MDLTNALGVSASGMTAQSTRLQVIAENIANSATTGSSPGADPYRRKTVVFANTMDQALGAEKVGVRQINTDNFRLPAALRSVQPGGRRHRLRQDAQRQLVRRDHGHEGSTAVLHRHLNVMETTRGMLSRTIDLLK